jgi:hypothetical protein
MCSVGEPCMPAIAAAWSLATTRSPMAASARPTASSATRSCSIRTARLGQCGTASTSISTPGTLSIPAYGKVKGMRISELSAASGVPAKTIRYYEQIGILDPAPRSANGYGIFPEEVVDRLAFVRAAQAHLIDTRTDAGALR